MTFAVSANNSKSLRCVAGGYCLPHNYLTEYRLQIGKSQHDSATKTYSIKQREMASKQFDDKLATNASGGSAIFATFNISCSLHIANGLC